jgi:DNA-binding Lrp family transcriptional regulator
MTLDPADLFLLQLLQDEFPLDPDPWEVLGRRLTLGAEEVLDRVRRLQVSGILRGICPILESGRAGIGASTLVALRVNPERVEEVARTVNGFPQVSHNYLRDNRYNLWFTLGAADREELESVLNEIRERCGLQDGDLLDLPVKRRFKIDVRFPVKPAGRAEHGGL